MPRLQLESATDVLDLGAITGTGSGLSALKGATGFGLPPISTQWLSGAGEGAVYRGGRVLPRDIDLPLLVAAANRPDLTALGSRLSRALAGPMTLRFIEDDGSSWTLQVRWVGGGDLTLGDTTDARTIANAVVTLRAGKPFWISSTLTRREIRAGTGRGLLPAGADGVAPLATGQWSLANLRVSPSQTIGAITMENLGDADAYPVWTITGPGDSFSATSSTGETFAINATLAAGEKRVVDVRAGTIVDAAGANRYPEFGTAPQLWRIPSGTTVAQVAFKNTTPASSIVAEWHARKWSII